MPTFVISVLSGRYFPKRSQHLLLVEACLDNKVYPIC